MLNNFTIDQKFATRRKPSKQVFHLLKMDRRWEAEPEDMTREDEKKMDELARRYVESHEPEVREEIYRLGREPEKMKSIDGLGFGLAPCFILSLIEGATMTGTIDRWIQLAELAELFGLSEESIKRLAKQNGFPLRRLTAYAIPGSPRVRVPALVESSAPVGRAVRTKRVSRSRNFSVPKHRR